LEIVNSLATEDFIMSFRRFVARRGYPAEVISDNALQFKTAKSVLNDPTVTTYASNHNVKWTFIPELAPWMGGFYERMIKIMKQAIRKSVGKTSLTLIQLQTIITEVESVVNSRPLVYVGSDFQSGKALSPSDFLSFNSKARDDTFQDYQQESDSEKTRQTTKQSLLKIWKKGQNYVKALWTSWRNDYLLSLRERTQMELKQPRVKSKVPPQIGDVVHVKENLPRGCWRLARVVDLVPSKDGLIRVAKVTTKDGRILTRAIANLYPLECGQEFPSTT
jgi:hypothetical protein